MLSQSLCENGIMMDGHQMGWHDMSSSDSGALQCHMLHLELFLNIFMLLI